MNEATIVQNVNKIPVKERMDFQCFLLKLMVGERLTQEADEEYKKRKFEWADKYAEVVRSIIDNTENKNVRELIMEGKYDEASILILKKLEENSKDSDLKKNYLLSKKIYPGAKNNL